MTQEQVAKAIGAPRPSIARWESGRITPSGKWLVALSKAYKCTMEDLLKEE